MFLALFNRWKPSNMSIEQVNTLSIVWNTQHNKERSTKKQFHENKDMDFPVDLGYLWLGTAFVLIDGHWLPFNMLQRRNNKTFNRASKVSRKNGQTQRQAEKGWQTSHILSAPRRRRLELTALADPPVENIHATTPRTCVWVEIHTHHWHEQR